ncbi:MULTISPECIES: hypothetical protein [Pseudoalteromonas]|uniref:Uncharacterized protein n=1 Tax=Pseudoalteromonas gelatinilytica TaxID=1703256 RepID=A0A3A3EYN0_9GAMM|nr:MULTISPECIES: hypothetical protein [Pseudoalteromonas]RJF33995.1 hypothetical protein D4741_16105 [Pseudoalteromonas profundi]TMO27013.1 hypothetical protein CWC28_12345 [Pseudoalteromonas sp. S4492]
MKKQLIPFVALLTITGTAQANEVNLQALQACTFVENDFNRLLCYDNVMAGKSLSKPATKQQIEQPAASSAAPVAAAPVTAAASTQIVKTKNEDFGLEHKEVAKVNDDQISAIVKSVKKAPYGELIIELDNGQQWRQVGSDSLRLKEQDVVVIERGVFNSFLLKVEGQNRSIRVKRTN